VPNVQGTGREHEPSDPKHDWDCRLCDGWGHFDGDRMSLLTSRPA
jgi:hypothetical protein